jgi:tetratricopeptide (TPR) repeat protein
LAKIGHLRTVCTVNFDRLIESALEAEGSKAESNYEVFYKDADLSSIDWKDQTKTRLIKLHGSAADANSMAITLRQVSSETLSMQRQGVIEYLFSLGDHEDVLVVGYSCSDLFDISPHIETLREKRKRIFLVEHISEDEHRAGSGVESLASEKNPFQGFARGHRLFCNTDRLVEAIWTRCLAEPYQFDVAPVPQKTWQRFVEDWYQQLITLPASQFALVGHLFARISAWNDAQRYFGQAVEAARAANDQYHVASYLSNLALAHTHLGNYPTAIESHLEAIEIARKTNHPRNRATNLQNLAGAYTQIGDPQRAMEAHHEALKIALELEDREGIAACSAAIGALASHTKQFEVADEYLNYALKVAEDDANLIGQARILGDLGARYQLERNLEAAKSFYEKSIKLARQIGLKEAEGKSLGNIGLIHLMRGDIDKAVECLQESMEIAHARSDIQGEGKCWGSLANIYRMQGDHRKAIDHYHRALSIARRIGDPGILVLSLVEMKSVYEALGDMPAARKSLEEAREILSQYPHLQAMIQVT